MTFFQKIFFVIGEDLELELFQALARRAAPTGDHPHLFIELVQAALADGVDDGGLGREEAVHIGRRHAQFRRDVGDRGLGIAQATEQGLRGLHDPRPGVFRPGFDEWAYHGSSPILTCDDFYNSSVRPCQGPQKPLPSQNGLIGFAERCTL